ncbi:unnamed protein product [Vitrella brassicaformis CCMP3155]|uniref:Potassium channel domain-containing protein n=3 Tax=Vitrella brassicaformis TaxID=1169539 RepID=A0A0G4FU53_VITBC|nr:unnamed protein product [Vitrella brassicaformis CCMP3155]|eukprot:CEM18493.1 unnamed protein product [Vitrella brassicaformis CCMP3155]
MAANRVSTSGRHSSVASTAPSGDSSGLKRTDSGTSLVAEEPYLHRPGLGLGTSWWVRQVWGASKYRRILVRRARCAQVFQQIFTWGFIIFIFFSDIYLFGVEDERYGVWRSLKYLIFAVLCDVALVLAIHGIYALVRAITKKRERIDGVLRSASMWDLDYLGGASASQLDCMDPMGSGQLSPAPVLAERSHSHTLRIAHPGGSFGNAANDSGAHLGRPASGQWIRERDSTDEVLATESFAVDMQTIRAAPPEAQSRRIIGPEQKRSESRLKPRVQRCGGFLRYNRVGRLLNVKMQEVSDLPAYHFARISQTLGWAVVWLWASRYLDRDSAIDPWSYHVPEEYDSIERIFLWIVSLDFCFQLIVAKDKKRFLMRRQSLLDFLTLPAFLMIVRLIVLLVRWFKPDIGDVNPEHYLLNFGFIRFLRLTGIEPTMSRVVPWLSPIRRRLISIVFGLSSILLTFSGAIFYFEGAPNAPDDDGGTYFRGMFDCIYFSIVTVSTVGYGDYTPEMWESKVVVVVVIILCLAYLPTEIRHLVDLTKAPKTIIGSQPTVGQLSDMIMISGKVPPEQLAVILSELHSSHSAGNSYSGVKPRVLVLTSREPKLYEHIVADALAHYNLRVCVKKGDYDARDLRMLATHDARAMFLFSDHQAADVVHEDRQTILKCLGVRKFARTGSLRLMTVQLNQSGAKQLAQDMGVHHVVCFNELKMKLIAKSVAGCPGFATLVANVFRKLSNDLLLFSARRLGLPGEDEYFRGADFQLYRVVFPQCMVGLLFHEVVRGFFECFHVFLIGATASQHLTFLNPSDWRVGSPCPFTSTPRRVDGVILAQSPEVVEYIQSLTKIPWRIRGGGKTRKGGKGGGGGGGGGVAPSSSRRKALTPVFVDERESTAGAAGGGDDGQEVRRASFLKPPFTPYPYVQTTADKERDKEKAAPPPPAAAKDDTTTTPASSPVTRQQPQPQPHPPARQASIGSATTSHEDGSKDGRQGGPKGSRSSTLSLTEAPVAPPPPTPLMGDSSKGSADRDRERERERQRRSSNATNATSFAPGPHDNNDDKASLSAVSAVSEASWSNPHNAMSGGIARVADLQEAKNAVFVDPSRPLIVVCGWPKTISVFFRAVRSSGRFNVCVVAPHVPPYSSLNELQGFSEWVVHIEGSPLRRTDLLRAGVLKAYSCVVFNCPHGFEGTEHTHTISTTTATTARRHKGDDAECILVAKKIMAMRMSQKKKEKGLLVNRAASSGSLSGPEHPALAVTHTHSTRQHTVLESMFDVNDVALQLPEFNIVTELNKAESIQFLDPSPWCPAASSQDTEDPETGHSDQLKRVFYMDSPEYMAGHVFVDEMLYPLAFRVRPVFPYAIESSIIDTMIEGFGTQGRTPVQLMNIAPQFHGQPFKKLFQYSVKHDGVIPIGILKALGPGALAFVCTCPRADCKLAPHDRVFAIVPVRMQDIEPPDQTQDVMEIPSHPLFPYHPHTRENLLLADNHVLRAHSFTDFNFTTMVDNGEIIGGAGGGGHGAAGERGLEGSGPERRLSSPSLAAANSGGLHHGRRRRQPQRSAEMKKHESAHELQTLDQQQQQQQQQGAAGLVSSSGVVVESKLSAEFPHIPFKRRGPSDNTPHTTPTPLPMVPMMPLASSASPSPLPPTPPVDRSLVDTDERERDADSRPHPLPRPTYMRPPSRETSGEGEGERERDDAHAANGQHMASAPPQPPATPPGASAAGPGGLGHGKRPVQFNKGARGFNTSTV